MDAGVTQDQPISFITSEAGQRMWLVHEVTPRLPTCPHHTKMQVVPETETTACPSDHHEREGHALPAGKLAGDITPTGPSWPSSLLSYN